MELNELKKIIKTSKDKVVIVENGKPLFVVTLFEDKSLENNEKVAEPEKNERIEDKDSEKELTLEDLPF